MDLSQEQVSRTFSATLRTRKTPGRFTRAILYGNLQEAPQTTRPRPSFRANLRSQNTHGHFTRAILCGFFSGKMPSANLISRHPFCASLRSWNADGHVRRAILCGNLQGKCGRVASGHRLVRTFQDLGKASPLPFPLLKGWTRAWYHPLFRGEFKQKKWTRAPVFVVKGRALHLVAAFHLALEHGNAFCSDLFWDALCRTGNPI